MTQAKGTVKLNDVLSVAILVMLSIVAIFSYFGMNSGDVVIDLSSLENRLDGIEAAQRVNTNAGEIVVDTSALEAKMAGFESVLDDLMDEAYASEKEQLELDGITSFEDEYDEEDLEDALSDLIVGFDKLRTVAEDEDFGEDGFKTLILNLGLDDSEDKKIIVQKLYNIKYELDDTEDRLKADVLVTGTVTYDDEDGFECDLVYELA